MLHTVFRKGKRRMPKAARTMGPASPTLPSLPPVNASALRTDVRKTDFTKLISQTRISKTDFQNERSRLDPHHTSILPWLPP